MRLLGIETSCDECAAAIVDNGCDILAEVLATQIPFHQEYKGVVPEIASRMHSKWINQIVQEVLAKASVSPQSLDGIAATVKPGLIGSLLVGLSFAKGMAWAADKVFLPIDHILAHLYAPQLTQKIEYPVIGVLVSGGHTIISVMHNFDDMEVIGTTLDDAIGEAFDKVSTHYNLGFPGGQAIDDLAQTGNPNTFRFPLPSLHKAPHPYDVSYSGLKTAVIHHLEKYRMQGDVYNAADLAASFQKTAIDILLSKIENAIIDKGFTRLIVGGGVAANSYLRSRLQLLSGVQVYIPCPILCTDNAAMVAGIAYAYLSTGKVGQLIGTASSRVKGYRYLGAESKSGAISTRQIL